MTEGVNVSMQGLFVSMYVQGLPAFHQMAAGICSSTHLTLNRISDIEPGWMDLEVFVPFTFYAADCKPFLSFEAIHTPAAEC